MEEPDFQWTQGDVPDPFVAVIRDAAGQLVNFTDAENIVFNLTNRLTGEQVVDGQAASVTNAPGTDGSLTFDFTSVSTAIRAAIAGDLDAEFEWDDGDFHYSAPTESKFWLRINPAVDTSDPYLSIYGWARDLLNVSDRTKLPDSRLQRYAASCVALMLDIYPSLGTYAGLSGTDKTFFDEGIGHLVAIRLRSGSPKTVPVGDLIRVHTLNTHFQYSDTLKGGQTIEAQWLDAARQAFNRVAAIKAIITARAGSFKPFRIAGPTRTARENGQHESLLSGLIRLLSEDAADTLESDDAAAWTL